MSKTILCVFIYSAVIQLCYGSKILCVFPTPTHGSNMVYRTLTKELVNRGNQLTILTTEPDMFKFHEENRVIDLGEKSHKLWARKYLSKDIRKVMRNTYFSYYDVMLEIIDDQLQTAEVVKLINTNTEKYDLLLVESYIPTWYGFAEKFNIPAIAISPEMPGVQDLDNMGVSTHPYLYPDNSYFIKHDMENIGILDRISLLMNHFDICRTFNKIYMPKFELLAKNYFGDNVSITRARKNIDVFLANIHPMMTGIRPTVPGLVFTGSMHVGQHKDLPEWLHNFMDSADNGVVLFSLGSNLLSQNLPPEKIQIFTEAFSELPYKFIWKWENKELPGHPQNVLIYDWTVQQDILANLKTMAFVTTGGRQSIDEAIHYQVPMVGIPIFGDHKFNVAKMTQLGLGLQLDFNTLTKDSLKNAIVEVINNQTYKHYLAEVFTYIEDDYMNSLDKAIWWIEYAIRHSGAHHIKHKHNFLSSYEYYFLDVIIFFSVLGLLALGAVMGCVLKIKGKIFKRRSSFPHYHDPKKMT